MTRKGASHDAYRNGRLAVEESTSNGCVEVFYIPSRERLEQAELNVEKPDLYRAKLLEFDRQHGIFTIFPINTRGRDPEFLKQEYMQIERITLGDTTPCVVDLDDDTSSSRQYFRTITLGRAEYIGDSVKEEDVVDKPLTEKDIVELLESLPPGFTKDYDFGLHLPKRYRFIIEAVEELSDCTEIFISSYFPTEVSEKEDTFYMSTQDFQSIRKSLENISKWSRIASKSVKVTETYNFLAEKLRKPTIPLSTGRNRWRGLLTDAVQSDENPLSQRDQKRMLGVFERNYQSLAEDVPRKLVKLQEDIELANLRVLITHFEEKLSKNRSEGIWQSFFKENRFVLNLAFGYPIILVKEKALVGGIDISGSGGTFTDYLFRNSLTNNAVIIEIKTPQTKLLNKTRYRKGVFVPSNILSGSVSQALDQKYELERNLTTLKVNSKVQDIESFSIHSCLIIGTIPSCEEQRKSFELFRGNSKDVDIVTFDELLEKLKSLHELLAPSPDVEYSPLEDDKLPF